MDESIGRFWSELLARQNGMFSLRFILQPTMATLLAFRDGKRDAQNGRPAYFWALFTDSAHRREMLHSGWRSIGKLVCMALALDVVYQIIATHSFRPLEAIVIASMLAVIPYVFLRGPINRLLRAWFDRARDKAEPPRKAA